ncbi:MAG TPA: mercuric reductase [Candidatus Acidoferrales bacterium]|nr:mercuric reductase [Candidatus Acidoferrales bacterium]
MSTRPLPSHQSSDEYDRKDLLNVRPADWKNPEPVERYNLVVIGAGPAGLLAALNAAKVGAKVAIIERDLFGGACFNVGCIPSKAIIRTSRAYAEMRDAETFGAQVPTGISVDFRAAMERMRRVRARTSRRVSAHRLSSAGVDVYFGEARFVARDAIEVDGKRLRFKSALVASGARPKPPSIPGIEATGYLTNENVWDLTECPRRLLVLGGGPLGCELAQAFCRLGSEVSIAQDEPMFLGNEERDAAQILSDSLARDGIGIHLNTQTVNVRTQGNEKIVELVSQDYKFTLTVDHILVGIGSAPNVEGMNLETAGVQYDKDGGIATNDYLQTSNPRIYAAGDVCSEKKFPHIEVAAASLVINNALFWSREKLSALAIPWCTYTDPEIAHIGLYVKEARARRIPVKTFVVMMSDVDRAITDGEDDGFVKIHVREGTDEILGATVAASHAGEMISEISLAMNAKIGLGALARVNHPYPTQAQAITLAANAYLATQHSPFRSWLRKQWLSR